MKNLARGKVDGFKLHKMKVGFELLKEVERVSEHPCTDIGELLKGIQRFDLLEKLGLPSPESKTSESAGTSLDCLPSRDERLQDLAQEQGHINSENPVSINIEDNDPLSMESVGTIDKEGVCVLVSSDQSGPSGASSICVSSSDSLTLRTTEGTPVCFTSSSQGCPERSEKAPAVALTTYSPAAPGEIVCESYLNTGSIKEEVPGQGQLLNSTDDVTDGENTEGATETSRSERRTFPLFEYDSQISSSDNSVFCRRLAYPVSSHVADGNPLQLQQSPSAHGQTALGMHGSDAASSSSAEWERLGARPKNPQAQRPQVAISPPPPPPIASPVSDGLAGDFLVRHSQDKAVLESLYTNDGNPLQLRQSSSAHGQTALGMHGSDAASSSSAEWERLSARLKNPQAQCLQVALSPPPPPLIAIPVSDGLARDFLARHSQDKAVLESLYTEVRDFSFLGNHTLQRTSFVDGKSNAPEACRVRSYLGACQAAAVRNNSYVRSDGTAFSRVLSGVFERTGLPGGSSYNESLCGNSALTAAVPLPSHTGTNDIEPIDDSLLALERRVADASALVERVLREREEREQFEREIERKERMIWERREREREEREIQKAERWPQQQEAVPARSPWLCEHYQRHCRVRFPCCTQFYPCHRCHNSSRNCQNEEAKACHATHLKCSFCQHEQEIDGSSGVCGKGGAKMGKNPYHCEKCGICRVHAGSLDEGREGNYKCRPESCHDKCCICLEDAFSGCQILPCSHRLHRECAIAIIQNGIRTCPVCRHPLYSTPNE